MLLSTSVSCSIQTVTGNQCFKSRSPLRPSWKRTSGCYSSLQSSESLQRYSTCSRTSGNDQGKNTWGLGVTSPRKCPKEPPKVIKEPPKCAQSSMQNKLKSVIFMLASLKSSPQNLKIFSPW